MSQLNTMSIEDINKLEENMEQNILYETETELFDDIGLITKVEKFIDFYKHLKKENHDLKLKIEEMQKELDIKKENDYLKQQLKNNTKLKEEIAYLKTQVPNY